MCAATATQGCITFSYMARSGLYPGGLKMPGASLARKFSGASILFGCGERSQIDQCGGTYSPRGLLHAGETL